MHTRFLPIFSGLAFALTLFFAVAAGAQEKSTGASLGGGGGVQVQQQDQPVSAQSSQGPIGTMAVEPQAQGCQGQKREFSFEGRSQDTDKDFHIEGDKFRVVYDVTFDDPADSNNEFTLNISNGSKFFTSQSTSNNHEEFVIDEGPGDFTLKASLRPQNKGTYSITVYDCTKTETSNNNNGGGGNNDGGTSTDTGTSTGTDTTGASLAQADTTGTTTAETTTANDTLNSLAETTTADNANGSNSDNFRCESFLHVVRDDNGALRNQYRGNQLVEHRFEQCLSGDVLANTIPNRRLPFTGGPPLPLAGGLLLLVALAVLAGRIIRR